MRPCEPLRPLGLGMIATILVVCPSWQWVCVNERHVSHEEGLGSAGACVAALMSARTLFAPGAVFVSQS